VRALEKLCTFPAESCTPRPPSAPAYAPSSERHLSQSGTINLALACGPQDFIVWPISKGGGDACFAAVFIALAAVLPAHGQSLEQQEKTNQLIKSLSALSRLAAVIDESTNLKKLQCVTAIASEPLCECLSKHVPVSVDFVGYVSIVTRTKDELGYDKLSPEDGTAILAKINRARAALDNVVAIM
jgi:hypothetical protein